MTGLGATNSDFIEQGTNSDRMNVLDGGFKEAQGGNRPDASGQVDDQDERYTLGIREQARTRHAITEQLMYIVQARMTCLSVGFYGGETMIDTESHCSFGCDENAKKIKAISQPSPRTTCTEQEVPVRFFYFYFCSIVQRHDDKRETRAVD